MVRPVAGTSQWRKLIQTKEYSDSCGAVWKTSAWKGLFWLIFLLLFLIISYSFFVHDQTGFLKNILFYAIMTVLIIIAVWVAGNFVWKSKGFVTGFLLALPIIFVFYAVMGYCLSFVGWKFQYGPITWIVIVAISLLGAKRIDGDLDKKDVFFGLMVFIIFVGANAPVFENGMGFFAKFDDFLKIIMDALSNIIHPENLIAH